MMKFIVIIFLLTCMLSNRMYSQILYPRTNFDPLIYFEDIRNDTVSFKKYFIDNSKCNDTLLYEFCKIEDRKKSFFQYSIENDTHITAKRLYFYDANFRIDSIYSNWSRNEYSFKYYYFLNKVVVINYVRNKFSGYDYYYYRNNILAYSATFQPDSQLSAKIYYTYNKKQLVRANGKVHVMVYEYNFDKPANHITIRKYNAESPSQIVEESQYVYQNNHLKYSTTQYSNLQFQMSCYIYQNEKLTKTIGCNSNGAVNEFIYKYQSD